MKLILPALLLMSGISMTDDPKPKTYKIQDLSLGEYETIARGLKAMPLSGDDDTNRDILLDKIIKQFQKQNADTTKK